MRKKIAVVTGSRRGIGLGIAKQLGQEGYFIVVNGTVPENDATSTLEELSGLGIEYAYVQGDISCAADRELLVNGTVERFGAIDVLVNNAGVAPTDRLDILGAKQESFDRLMNINLKGTFFMCQLAANAMMALQKKGLEDYTPRIINLSSISAYTSSTNRGEYCISKAGISMVTQLFADRLADEGIPVFEVRPGIILTDMTAGVREKYEKLIADGVTPIRRFGLPQDVANCVSAACSGRLDFSTGQVLNADGGFHLRRL